MGDPPGPTVPPYAARRRFARRLPVHSGRSRERRLPTPLLFKSIAHRGLAARPGSCRIIAGRGQNLRKWGREMRVLLPAYGSRGDVEPLAGLAVRLRAPGAEAAVAAPPAVAAAGPAVPAGGDRHPGAVGPGRPKRERAVRLA